MQKTHLGGSTFSIGQTITEILTVSVTSASTPIFPSSSIHANEVIPVGMSNVSVTGKDWSIVSTGSTSPLLISAIYVGDTPVGPGTSLPPLIITGTVNADASAVLIDAGSASISGDGNPMNNLATDTFFLSSAPYTPTPPVSVIPSPMSSPTPVVLYTPIPLPANLPDVAIMQVQPCSNLTVPRVGTTRGVILTVTNGSLTTPINQTIHVSGVIPMGLTNIKISGKNWAFTLSSTISPMIFEATYSSPYLLAPSASLPSITLLGTLTTAAVPSITDYFESSIIGDSNSNNNYVTSTFPVLPALTPHVAPMSALDFVHVLCGLMKEEDRRSKNFIRYFEIALMKHH